MSVGTYSVGNKVINKNNNNSQSWRLVHDGICVISIFQSSGYTETIHELEIRGSKQLCIDRANQLGLTFSESWDSEYLPPDLPDISDLDV